MSAFLDELSAYVSPLVSCGVFVDTLPPAPDDCVCLIASPGSRIGDQRDVPELAFPRFQVVVRNLNHASGWEDLQAVRTALHGLYNYDLPSWNVIRVHAEQEGGPMGRDEVGRFEFSINFSGEYRPL